MYGGTKKNNNRPRVQASCWALAIPRKRWKIVRLLEAVRMKLPYPYYDSDVRKRTAVIERQVAQWKQCRVVIR